MFLILTKLSHIDYTLFCVVKTNQTFRRIFTHNPVDVLYLRNKKINCLVFIVKSIWLLQISNFYWGVYPIPIVQCVFFTVSMHLLRRISNENIATEAVQSAVWSVPWTMGRGKYEVCSVFCDMWNVDVQCSTCSVQCLVNRI